MARCGDCGHGYVWPVPSPEFLDSIYRSESYYEGSEDSIGFRDYASLEPAPKRMFERHLARIETEIAAGRILDVGCANSDFLKVARSHGSVGFLADRALYLGPPGRAAGRALSGSRPVSAVVDMPQINQFALGVRPPVTAKAAVQGVAV